MTENATRCECSLDDCAYFNAVAGAPGQCDCTHPDKPYYMVKPCPLYKKEWKQTHRDAKHFREMLRKKRKL